MSPISKFPETIKTSRLLLRSVLPTEENAKLMWNEIKKENPQDFPYIRFSPNGKTYLPTSEKETLDTLLEAKEVPNSINYWVYYKDKFIGFVQIIYWEKRDILEMARIWFVKSAWGNGFASEINKAIEEITFSKTKVLNMGWQCYEDNADSKKTALRNGYKLVKEMTDPETSCNRLVFIKEKISNNQVYYDMLQESLHQK